MQVGGIVIAYNGALQPELQALMEQLYAVMVQPSISWSRHADLVSLPNRQRNPASNQTQPTQRSHRTQKLEMGSVKYE